MHERKTLNVRNPLKPVPERLPCRLTRDEKYAKIERRLAVERDLDELTGQIEALKAKTKLKVAEINERVREVQEEMRTLREQVVSGEEIRLVDCYLLEDLQEGALYTYRIDTGEVVSRKDMNPDELAKLRSRLPLEEPVQKTVDIPEDVRRVRRFDSDPLETDQPLIDAAEPADPTEDDEHEHTFDDGECAVCGEPEPELEAQKPTRRKRGNGKRSSAAGDETAHIRAAEAAH